MVSKSDGRGTNKWRREAQIEGKEKNEERKQLNVKCN
jgi:hypothetical protein